jgi:hypothetical protein
MTPTNIIPFPDIRHALHCGGCPVCGKNDGYLNLGAQHWFICRTHKTKWFVGENLFDSWMTQTIPQHLVAEQVLQTYHEVTPLREQVTGEKLMFPLD